MSTFDHANLMKNINDSHWAPWLRVPLVAAEALAAWDSFSAPGSI